MLLIALFTPTLSAITVRATTRTVTNLADDGTSGTLRSVIAAAADNDTITFQSGLTGTIQLVRPGAALVLTKNVTITGPGASVIAVQGQPSSIVRFRALTVNSLANATVSGLTFQNGASIGTPGGLISNAGTLTLTDSVVTGGNFAHDGGGIANTGTLTINRSTIVQQCRD